MCYHTALFASPRQLAARFARKEQTLFHFRPSYHISAFTHAQQPVITDNPRIEYMRWGLIPFWTPDIDTAQKIRNQTINARSETIFTKPSFRQAIRKQRCLVPVTGFFDWRHENNEKIPYYISLKNEKIFSLAGIYDLWHDKITNREVYTYSIITTVANDTMRYIHNTNYRMPVILSRTQESLWLDSAQNQQQLQAMMQPFDNNQMNAYQIERDFMRKAPDDPTILKPAETPPATSI